MAHIVPVTLGGAATQLNLVVLCPNHHKMFDLGDVTVLKNDSTEVAGTLNDDSFRITR